MKNPNTYGEFTCHECNWTGGFKELENDEGDFGCPECQSEVFESCPFCGDEFDTDSRVCARCKEQI